MASEHNPRDLVNHFLQNVGFKFIDDLISEIGIALKDDNPIIPAFNVFLPSEINSLVNREGQFKILRDHYGQDLTDVLNNESTRSGALINSTQQQIESEEFFADFEDTYRMLLDRVKSASKTKLQSGELKQATMYEHINANKPTAADVYAAMCQAGCLLRHSETMKLFKFALLIPPSTSGVERGFSVMNLLITPLRTSLNEANVDRLMRICINGSNRFTEQELELLVDKYKNSANRRIKL